MTRNKDAVNELLSGLTLDAGRAYQENLRLYGEAKAREMHDTSNRNIATVNKLLTGVETLLDAVEHEGSMKAIKAGMKVENWQSQLTPTLRAAYEDMAATQTAAGR